MTVVRQGLELVLAGCGRRWDLRPLAGVCRELLGKAGPFAGAPAAAALAGDPEFLPRVLEPFLLGCEAVQVPRVAEPAVRSLAHLVSLGLLAGETSVVGLFSEDSLVAKVVLAVTKCGESSDVGVQAAVIDCLATFIRSTEFVIHGEVLLRSIRIIFNISLGSPEEDVQKAAAENLKAIMAATLEKAAANRPVEAAAEAAAAPADDLKLDEPPGAAAAGPEEAGSPEAGPPPGEGRGRG